LGSAIVLSVVAVACGGDGGDGDAVGRTSSQDSTGVAEDGVAATEFVLADGTAATLGEVAEDRPLVLNFFASWCAPCRAEMPDFAEVHGDVGDRVSFLGLAVSDSDEATPELVELTGVAYPWGFDPTGEIFASFGAFQMPTTVFVAADGRVVRIESAAASTNRCCGAA
jgi:thiol-disulfide isomerase/thioredoxin